MLRPSAKPSGNTYVLLPHKRIEDRILTNITRKCDCFCGDYKCPRDGSTALSCELTGNKLKRDNTVSEQIFNEAKAQATNKVSGRAFSDTKDQSTKQKTKRDNAVSEHDFNEAKDQAMKENPAQAAEKREGSQVAERRVATVDVQATKCADDCESQYQLCVNVSHDSGLMEPEKNADSD